MKILGFLMLSMVYMCSSGGSESDAELASLEMEEAVYDDVSFQDQNASTDSEKVIEQKIIKNGNLRFETQNLSETKSTILKAVEATNGYIQNERSGKDYNSNYQELQLRIPSENFQKALTIISDGVEFYDEKSISQRDVTEEFIDLEARLKAKRELESRYLQLLEQAKSVKEILEIERELAIIREEIEAKEGRLNYLKKQVSYSTLHIYFYKTSLETGVTHSYGSKIIQALKGGWQGISTFLLGIIYIWPFIILLILAIFLVRRWKRRKSLKK